MLLLFNGPPGSGKDEACLHFMKKGFKHLSFKEELFKETLKFFGVSKGWFMKGYNDRSIKEKPVPELKVNGVALSRRDAMIYVSEKYIKPKYGNDFFGRQLSSHIKPNMQVCISDGGFVEELHPVINTVGADNIAIVQLTRDGCDFSSDSRRYFDGSLVEQFIIGKQTDIPDRHVLTPKFPVRMYRIHNNGSIDQFRQVLNTIYEKERNEHRNQETKAESIPGESLRS